MIHKSHVKFISFNATLFLEVIAEKGKQQSAFIDQRAVAAAKKREIKSLHFTLFGRQPYLCLCLPS